MLVHIPKFSSNFSQQQLQIDNVGLLDAFTWTISQRKLIDDAQDSMRNGQSVKTGVYNHVYIH